MSLFAGEITVDSLDLRASVAAGSVSASGNVSASTLTGLTVLGQLITPAPNLVVPLADWGTLEVLGSQVDTTQKPPRSATATVTALRVKLIADHGGLAPGSVIEIGAVTAAAAAAPAVIAPTEADGPPATTHADAPRDSRPTPRASPARRSPARRRSSFGPRPP